MASSAIVAMVREGLSSRAAISATMALAYSR